jgi:hypothetical protein
MANSQEEAREPEVTRHNFPLEEIGKQEATQHNIPIVVPTENEIEPGIADFDPPSVRAYLLAKYGSHETEATSRHEDTFVIDPPRIPAASTTPTNPLATVKQSASKNILSELVQPFRQPPITRRTVTSPLPTIGQSRPGRYSNEHSNFLLWRLSRPFWGSILMMMASLLMLWGPVSLLRFALLPGSSIWAGILVGVLLFIMALIQLLAPSYAVITGGIGVALSLVSLLVAGFGGLGIGVILGTIGSALGIAWKPSAQPFPIKQR